MKLFRERVDFLIRAEGDHRSNKCLVSLENEIIVINKKPYLYTTQGSPMSAVQIHVQYARCSMTGLSVML